MIAGKDMGADGGVSLSSGVERVLEAFGVSVTVGRQCSFAFSSKPASAGWVAFSFDLPFLFYYVKAPHGVVTQVKSLCSGIASQNFVVLAVLDDCAVLVLRRPKKEDVGPLLLVLRREEDFDRVVSVARKFDFGSGELLAHASLSSVVDLLRGGAERDFVNRGLFSSYFLKERMADHLSKRERNPSREAAEVLERLGGEFPAERGNAVRVLEALGYSVEIVSRPSDFPEYGLRFRGVPLDVACVVADVDSLDIKMADRVAASYQAVVALQRKTWVVLTNGRLWRLYSSRVSSSSTNYFEVDLEGVAVESDARLVYFVSLFSASAFLKKEEIADVDLVFDEGVKHAHGIEEDLRQKVFDGKLFLNLVKGILNHDASRVYSQGDLDDAKAVALKLLYRLLFVLYAESRGLLPIENEGYREVSLESLRSRLSAFEKEPESVAVWDGVRELFRMISEGDVDANLPQYDGELFEKDDALDGIAVKNRFLVPALRDLMESESGGIDYQSLGVRHLGSLYEALLEYSVRQAKESLVVYKEEILDAKYAEDLKQKPLGFIEKCELYLSVKGLERKGTGSYYTPDEIVTWLVKKGLEPHFKAREERFRADLELLRASKVRDPEVEKRCTNHLLGLRIVDPAMGSGHFLVAAVNEVTGWIIGLLKENPDAPLLMEIESYRKEILEGQRKRGIRIDEVLLTDTVLLKRLVMKRCVYGVDINPLAVDLAKVSLWLDSFTIGTPLTFLDYHIHCGDSLIGLWVDVVAPRYFQSTIEAWRWSLSVASTKMLESVSNLADLTVEQVTESRKSYEEIREATKPKRVLLDMETAGIINPDLKGLPKNLEYIEEVCEQKVVPDSKQWAKVEEALRSAEKYRFFHWELEFHDVFSVEPKGFDLVVMNPPWDVVKPEDDDFFSVYYPRFRRIKSKPEKRKIMQKLLKDKAISEAYAEYKKSIEEKVRFFKESGEYRRRGSGDTNCWKLFLERVLGLAGVNGSYALVIPSGIVTDEGGKQLREALFEGRIRAMYEFENKCGIFPAVHRSYKFVLLVADKAKPPDSFPAAFYLHKITALEGKTEQEKFVEIPAALIKLSAPESLSIPEVRNKAQLEVFQWLYEHHPLLSDNRKEWSVAFVREFDRTNDSDIFHDYGKGWPLIEGKNFQQFLPDYDKPIFSIDPETGLKRTDKHKEFRGINNKIHETVRLAFRDVSSSTNVRSVIACLIPPHTFTTHKAPLVVPRYSDAKDTGLRYGRLIAFLVGIFNSFVFDFLVRTRISMNVCFFYLEQTPIPTSLEDELSQGIIDVSVQLSCSDDRFAGFSALFGKNPYSLSIGERIELCAKLNALVSKLYGLSREHLTIILESFEGFKENRELEKMKEVKWNDALMREFNGEVRKRVLRYFDQLNQTEVKPQ
jgi:hypothetical protein